MTFSSKLFVFSLFSSLLFLTSCSFLSDKKPDDNVKSSKEQISLVNSKDIIEGSATVDLIDNKYVISADGSFSKSGLTYVFAYFGTGEDRPVNMKDAPRYKFGEALLDTYELTLSTISPITPELINPYYVLKRDYSFKSFRIDNNIKRELKNQETRPQSFYTSLDKDTIIPDVTFDGFNYFNYFLDENFTSPLFTFGDLYKVNKDVYSTVYGVSRSDNSVLKYSSFDVDYILNDFGIENVKNYYLTRDKKHFLDLVSSLEDFKYVTSKNYIALYSSKFNSLYVLLDKFIELNEDGRVISIVPRIVENVYINSPNNKVLFSVSSSFKGLFKNSTAKTIDITNNSPNNLSNVSHMFSGASNLESVIGLNTIDTTYSKSFSYMFYKTNKLNSVDLSSLNTSNAKDMAHMFDSTGLNNIDISNFNTMFVEDMKYMFNNTRSDSFDISHFNTGNAIDLRYMLSNIDQIDVVKFNSDLRSAKYFDGFLKNTSVIDLEIPYLKNGDITFKDFLSDATVLNLNLEHSNFKSVLNFFSTILTSNIVISKSINLSHMFFKEQADTNSFFHNLFDKFKDVDIKYSNFMVSEYDYDLSGLLTDLDLSKLNFKYLDSWDVSKAAVFNNFFLNSYFPTLSRTNIISLPYWDMSSCISMDYFLTDYNLWGLEIGTYSKKGGTVTSCKNFISNSGEFNILHLPYFKILDEEFLANKDVKPFSSIDLHTTSILSLFTIRNLYNNNEDVLESFKIDTVLDLPDSTSKPPISLNSLFNGFKNVETLVIKNMDLKNVESFNEMFVLFGIKVRDKDVHYDISNWTLKNSSTQILDFSHAFVSSDFSMFDLSNWLLCSDSSRVEIIANNMFQDCVTYNETKTPLFKFSDISAGDKKIYVNLGYYFYSRTIFRDVNYAPDNTPSQNKKIKEQVVLDFSNWTFDFLSDPDYYTLAGDTVTGGIIFNHNNYSHVNLFISLFRLSTTEKVLNFCYLDNISVDYNNTNFIKAISDYFNRRQSKLSYKYWSFQDNFASLKDFFYNVKFVKEDFNTWDISNITDFSGMFRNAIINNKLHINFGQNKVVNASRMFAVSSIHEVPTFYVGRDVTFNNIAELFYDATSYKPLDLTSLTLVATGSISYVFGRFSFHFNVNEEDRVVDISGSSKDNRGWDLSKADPTSASYFFSTIKANDINTLKFNYTDVHSFKMIKDCIYNIATFIETSNPTPLKSLDLKYMELRDTGDRVGDSNYKLFESGDTKLAQTFIINCDYMYTTDAKVNLSHLFHNTIYMLSNTDSSTFIFNNVVDLTNTFYNCLDLYNHELNLTNFTPGDDYNISFDYFLARLTPNEDLITLLVTNRFFVAQSSMNSMFLNTTFGIWEFSDFFGSRDCYDNTDLWRGAYYPEYHPYDSQYPEGIPRPWL